MQTTMKARPIAKKPARAIESLLGKIVKGKELLKRRKGAKFFSQGEAADAIYFLRTGRVQLTVVSPQGKKVVMAMAGPDDFVGEECLVGDSLRTSTATAMRPSTAFRIEKRAMLGALRVQPEFSKEFVTSLLARNANMEEDLCDQLFNHSELRLACALLKLSRKSRHAKSPDVNVLGATHKKLAKLIGTTPSRIIFYMHKFKKLGLIEFKGDGDIKVMPELLTDMVVDG